MESDKKLKSGSSDLLVVYGEAVDRAIKRAVRDALLKHKQANNPVAIWRDGKVVLLQPAEILTEKDDSDLEID